MIARFLSPALEVEGYQCQHGSEARVDPDGNGGAAARALNARTTTDKAGVNPLDRTGMPSVGGHLFEAVGVFASLGDPAGPDRLPTRLDS